MNEVRWTTITEGVVVVVGVSSDFDGGDNVLCHKVHCPPHIRAPLGAWRRIRVTVNSGACPNPCIELSRCLALRQVI